MPPGDAINAALAAVEYNFGLLLRPLVRLLYARILLLTCAEADGLQLLSATSSALYRYYVANTTN
jgi:hypothetical protein